MIKNPFSASASAKTLIVALLAVLIISSCTEPPPKYTLRHYYGPIDTIFNYSLELERDVTSYRNDSLRHTSVMRVKGAMDFSTAGIEDDSIYTIMEKDLLEIDQIVDDTGQATRLTRTVEYEIRQTYLGEVLDAKVISGEIDAQEYVYQYFRQGAVVLPKEAIPIGHKWTQTYRVETETGDTVETKTHFKLKGQGTKSGYDCLIIEYQGEGYIPVRDIPGDTLQTFGHDKYISTGIVHMTPDGLMISFEEKRRIDYQRRIIKDGREIHHKSEAKDFIRYYINDTLPH